MPEVRHRELLAVRRVLVAVLGEIEAVRDLRGEAVLGHQQVHRLLLDGGVGVVLPRNGKEDVIPLAVVQQVPLHLDVILSQVLLLGRIPGQSGRRGNHGRSQNQRAKKPFPHYKNTTLPHRKIGQRAGAYPMIFIILTQKIRGSTAFSSAFSTIPLPWRPQGGDG